MKKKRHYLRVSEQLLIVFAIAVLLPLIVSAFIITNVNQHSVRKELENSVNIAINGVYQRLSSIIDEKKAMSLYIARMLEHIKSPQEKQLFLQEVTKSSSDNNKIELVDKTAESDANKYIPDFSDSNIEIYHDKTANNLVIYAKVKDKKYVKQYINLTKLQARLFKSLINDAREIYIVDSQNNILMSYNNNKNDFSSVISFLPKKYKVGIPIYFGNIKNQPNIFLKLQDPKWSIIVITPQKLTKTTIINARYKIIHALVIAAITIIIIGVLYSYSLSRNIRQLLKAISAIACGNYKRRIRLLSNFLTPLEVISLVEEFNNMVTQIYQNHKDLKEANIQLSKLDEIKSNLIDTVSHEFRTPLTCIKGYTSRLLRNDDKIDDETKRKSLKIIKQQTERLSRMVEDLLVIPDIESSRLRIVAEYINLKELIESCILSIQQKQYKKIIFTMENNENPNVYADNDRVEQIIINLLDNALKYSPEDSEIKVNVTQDDNFAIIKIHNKCEPITGIKINTLFDKFSRIDDHLTRTTRGTGLGLFIAKGLIESMGGKISLSAEDGFEVTLKLPVQKSNDE